MTKYIYAKSKAAKLPVKVVVCMKMKISPIPAF